MWVWCKISNKAIWSFFCMGWLCFPSFFIFYFKIVFTLFYNRTSHTTHLAFSKCYRSCHLMIPLFRLPPQLHWKSCEAVLALTRVSPGHSKGQSIKGGGGGLVNIFDWWGQWLLWNTGYGSYVTTLLCWSVLSSRPSSIHCLLAQADHWHLRFPGC